MDYSYDKPLPGVEVAAASTNIRILRASLPVDAPPGGDWREMTVPSLWT
jgi:hypothetical protein